MSYEHRVIVVGGGFGGRRAAKAPKAAPVTLIDRRNSHLLQPLLYQVATGGPATHYGDHPYMSRGC